MNFSLIEHSDGTHPDIKLLVMRPDDLEEAKSFPGACQALAIWNDTLDLDTLVRFLNTCLTKINHGR